MRVFAVLSMTMLVGCILVVSPEEYGTVCHFQGEETQCGACIAANCQAGLTECCRDEGCEQPLRSLDECATHHTQECNTLKGTTIPTTAIALAQCMKTKCDAVCTELKGAPTTSCREPRLGEGSACTCTSGGEVNDVVCNPQAFPQTICCAPEAWPAAGLECKCQALDCRAAPDGCFCRLADFTPKMRECEAKHCCAGEDYCQCRSTECTSFERPVTTCTIAELRCEKKGQKQFGSCSARTP